MSLSRPALLFISILLLSPGLAAQQSDPQGVALAGRALLALTGGAPVNDVVLSGTATRIAGSDHESGTVTLKARGTQQGRIDLALPSGRRAEIRGLSGGFSAGNWFGPDGVSHPIALHNCWTDAAWFFPALSSLATASAPDVVVSYVGHEVWQGVAIEHLRFSRNVSAASPITAQLIRRWSTSDIYLDSTTLLPVGMTFNLHPDNDGGIDIAAQIRFSDYRVVNGVRVPFRIQKFIHGGLTLDLSISNASLNVGLQDSDFPVQ